MTDLNLSSATHPIKNTPSPVQTLFALLAGLLFVFVLHGSVRFTENNFCTPLSKTFFTVGHHGVFTTPGDLPSANTLLSILEEADESREANKFLPLLHADFTKEKACRKAVLMPLNKPIGCLLAAAAPVPVALRKLRI